jgi:6-phosphogluconolactonase
MLLVNYWDSVIATMPICPNGMLSDISVKLEPPKKVVARHIEDHLHNRQSEPHAHAIGEFSHTLAFLEQHTRHRMLH